MLLMDATDRLSTAGEIKRIETEEFMNKFTSTDKKVEEYSSEIKELPESLYGPAYFY